MADPAVSDVDFRDILDATRLFIRSAVMPRELEIMNANRVPDDIRDQAMKMGLFGYAIPQEWGGARAEHRPGRRDGEVVPSFALTEPGARSNPAGLRTKAVRDAREPGPPTAASTGAGGSKRAGRRRRGRRLP
jgi:acyl-CoA dehydrogenase